MRSKNPAYMAEILEYVEGYITAHHRSPSCREIADRVTLGRSAVHRYLVAMNEAGMLEYDGQTILTPSLRDRFSGMRRIGIVGSVACGLPSEAGSVPEESMTLPVSMTGEDEMYLLYATGDSMVKAGIESGDMVLVRRQETARDGDIVVAWVEGEGNTLKRYRKEGSVILLHPENDAMEDIRPKNFRVQGVAVWVFKKVG